MSTHSKSPNSSRFNPILQKFCKMIYEIIFSETACGISLNFFWSSFICNFMVKNSFSQPKNQRKLDISRPIYFLKNSTSFCRSYLYKQAGRIFFKTVVFKDLNLFWRQQHDWFGHHLFLKSYLSHTSYLKVLGHSEHLGIWSFETLYLADPSLVDTRSRFNVYKTPIQRHQLRIDVL